MDIWQRKSTMGKLLKLKGMKSVWSKMQLGVYGVATFFTFLVMDNTFNTFRAKTKLRQHHIISENIN